MRCPACSKAKLVAVDDIRLDLGTFVFIVRGDRCASCREEFIRQEDSERAIREARKLGLWGNPLTLRRKLSRSGRGIVLRIPRDLQESMGLHGSERVGLTRVGRHRVLLDFSGKD